MTTTLNHVFPSFSERHPSFEKFGEISRQSIELFEKRSPAESLVDMLVDFWNEYGEGRFSNGLLLICDPVKYQYILNFFFPEKKFYPIAFASFGRIFFTDFIDLYYFTPVYGWYTLRKLNYELLFEVSLESQEFLDDVLDRPFHNEAIEKLGKLEPGEIFGFEPAIALGGNDEDISNVKKLQMDVHLAFLAQLVDIEER